MDRKFKCRFFGYVELSMSLSEMPDDHRQKILKIAISKLCRTRIMNDEEIDITSGKIASVSNKKKSFFKTWKKIKNLKIEINAWNISILNDKE